MDDQLWENLIGVLFTAGYKNCVDMIERQVDSGIEVYVSIASTLILVVIVLVLHAKFGEILNYWASGTLAVTLNALIDYVDQQEKRFSYILNMQFIYCIFLCSLYMEIGENAKQVQKYDEHTHNTRVFVRETLLRTANYIYILTLYQGVSKITGNSLEQFYWFSGCSVLLIFLSWAYLIINIPRLQ